MSINFPTTLDTFTNPNPNDPRNAPSLSGQMSDKNDAITALEAKVGANSSAVTTSHDYKLSGVTGTDKAVSKTGTETLTNKTLTAPVVNIGSDATGDMYYRNASGILTRLPAGTNGQIISYLSGIPTTIPNPSASDASTTVKGVVEEATSAEIIAGTGAGDTSARLFMNPSTFLTALPTVMQATKLVKFGGTGADGALTITSGATNIDLGNVAVVTKNYTSISITGTGSLTFTNPHSAGTIIILKSQGAVILTSSTAPMIDASGLGASGGSGGAPASGDGSDGTAVTDIIAVDSSNGKLGLRSTSANPTNGGVVYTLAPTYTINANRINVQRKLYVTAGSGGGGGGGQASAGSTSGGIGGRGGGGLIIECAGALNFTTALGISVAGKIGGAPAIATGSSGGAGGGGGGAGGMAIILYNTLTSASGTVNITGGDGGQGGAGSGSGSIGAQGGGGAGLYAGAGGRGGGGGTGGGASSAGLAGTNSVTTSAGGGAGGLGRAGGAVNDGGGGGGGCAGEYVITANTVFA